MAVGVTYPGATVRELAPSLVTNLDRALGLGHMAAELETPGSQAFIDGEPWVSEAAATGS